MRGTYRRRHRAQPAAQRATTGPTSPWLIRCALATVVATAMGVSAWWVVHVPIFAAPDEDVHFDYVASLITAGRPMLASERPVAEIAGLDPFVPVTHPYTWHLARWSGTKTIRFHPELRAPAGYGSKAFFAAVDRSAPALSGPPPRNPWTITEYPIGYYGLAALWASAWSHVFPGLVALFFAMRALSVLLLACGMLAWWLLLRCIGCPPWRALGVLAVVALLPMTAFVSSYVQPDNLGFAMVPLCLWLGLRVAAVDACSVRRLALVGIALAGLLLTKYHVMVAVGMPLIALLAVAHRRAAERRWLDWGLLLLGPSLLAAELQRWISASPGATLRNLTSGSARWGLIHQLGDSRLRYLAAVVRRLATDVFSSEGTIFRTSWSRFGWNDTPLTIVSPAVDDLVLLGLQVGLIALLALCVVRWQQAVVALASHWNAGRRSCAIRLLAGNVMLNAYVCFAGLLLALYVYTNGVSSQGRHWYAFLPAIVWVGVDYAPRALASRAVARWLSRVVLAAALVYGGFASCAAMRSIEGRYYGAPHGQPSP